MNSRKDGSKNGKFIFQSDLLGREVPFDAFFPENYSDSGARLPVLYLLHGLFGHFDNWLTNTGIVEYSRKSSFVIICPEGGDNWYSDSPYPENHFYESCFLKEMIPFVEARLNVGRARERRAIAGLSMGGYGAFKFAFRQPEMFRFAASMSGAFHAAEIFKDDVWAELQNSVFSIFANDDSLRKQNDLFQTIENLPAAQISALPQFYFDCGTEDGFLPINLRLAEALRTRGISHEFKTFSGGHDWDYWNQRLENILQTADRAFACKFK